jgi:hypothetical protein
MEYLHQDFLLRLRTASLARSSFRKTRAIARHTCALCTGICPNTGPKYD